MTATAESVQGYESLLRDVRHLSARAASDLADWLAYLTVDGKADRTLYSYTRQIAALLREVPDKELGQITASDINGVLAQIPVQSRYITRSVFNSFFAWAAADEHEDEDGEIYTRIPRNPVTTGVPRMRPPRHRPKDIFSEEEVALLEALPMPDGPLLTLMFSTGLRRAECRFLRRDHIDLNRALLIVYQGKGDKDRIISMPTQALQAVADLDITEGLRADDYLWYSLRGGGRHFWRRTPAADSTFDRWWRGTPKRPGVLARAGVRYLNPHQTRHTYGAKLRERGYDIEERQVLMGHESIKTTQHYYGRVTIEDVSRKMAEIGL